jgi:carbamoylphosphate synthase large subunit
MILEKMLNGHLSVDQLARIINVDITERHLSGMIRVAESYDPTKYWEFDFSSQTARSSVGELKCIADTLAEALLRFYKSAGSYIDFWESRKSYVQVDGGYIDVDTLKTVWPIPGRNDHIFLSNGLAMAN